MAKIFIHRPIFAWVIAIFMVLAGILAIPQLPIARFPSVAPPSVSISVSYPGATPQVLNDSVISLIERELTGVKNLLYFSSSADTSGSATITATFKPSINVEMAQMDVQNQLKSVEPRLPHAVRQSGVSVEAASSGFLMLVGLSSQNSIYSEVELGDFLSRNIVPDMKRIDGVGKVQLFGAEKAMRIWVDPDRLVAYSLSINDLSTAIAQQNTQISPGIVGSLPARKGTMITVPLNAQGELSTVKAFENIILRSDPTGSKVTLKDVARVELGASDYGFEVFNNGNISSAIAIQMSPGANAIKTSDAVKQRLSELESILPASMSFSIFSDTAPFVKLSIEKVVITLFEAMFLVFIVMYLFLHNVRYTLIPSIVAPISLLATFAVMYVLGFSINVLTMFGMVLAIGIIVDDAIVVIENVERIMVTDGLSPKDATLKAMGEITNPIIGITLVLSAVFLPMALAEGSMGIIYRQFTVTLSVSIIFSAFLALSLTPALCATLLKPHDESAKKWRFFMKFDELFERFTQYYGKKVASIVRSIGKMMCLFIVLVGILVVSFQSVPTAFVPDEDQGEILTSFQLPSDAGQERTLVLVKQYEDLMEQLGVAEKNLSIMGYGFGGSGQSAALAFTTLKDSSGRVLSSKDVTDIVNYVMMNTDEGQVISAMPPSIDEMGTTSGFTLMLQDRGNLGMEKLRQAQIQLLALAKQSKLVKDVYSDGLPYGDSVYLDIDRDKAYAYGVKFDDISSMISSSVGSIYINDFPHEGRLQQVILQADAKSRSTVEDILKLYVRNDRDQLVKLSEFVTAKWEKSAHQYDRYNGYPAMSIVGSPVAGISTGDALAEMERLVAKLPTGVGYEWTGVSLQEKNSESQILWLLGLSIFVIFLVLAALYESWSIPLSVILVVPLGMLGAVLAILLRDYPNDIFFKIGLITIIGLSAKNAILIVEFAKTLRQEGLNLIDATVAAAKLRLRPIIMTSIAFTFGVFPLVIATGSSSETQRALGTGVFGGMISATVLAIFFVPVFFVFVIQIVDSIRGCFKSKVMKSN